MEAISAEANTLFVSAVTAWEIAIKCAAGKLTFPIEEYEDVLVRIGAASLSIEHGHAIHAANLPSLHQDPFDRLLVAQAQIENMVLVTRDSRIARYDVQQLRA